MHIYKLDLCSREIPTQGITQQFYIPLAFFITSRPLIFEHKIHLCRFRGALNDQSQCVLPICKDTENILKALTGLFILIEYPSPHFQSPDIRSI